MRATHTFSICTLSITILLAVSPRAGTSPLSNDPPVTTADSTSTAAQQDDDDTGFEPAEPDFRLINLPSTARLPKFKGNFSLTHRFAGNLRRGSFSDQASSLFGIDEGAVVGFEYRFGIARGVEAIAYRSAFLRTVQFHGKYDVIRQRGSMPFSASAVVSVEGIDNFQEQYAPALGVTVSRRLGDVAAFYAVPTWVHNSAAAAGIDRNTFFVGVGGRVQIWPTVYVAAEVSPRASGYAPGEPEFGFAIEKRVGGHTFQLNVTNTSGTTLAQVARGGAPKSLFLGFNLSRKFF